MAKGVKGKYTVLYITLGIVALYIGLLFYSKNLDEKKHEEITVQNYYDLKNEKEYIYELGSFIDKNIQFLDKEEATEVIEDYLFVLQDKADSLTYYAAYMNYEFKNYEDENLIESFEECKNVAIKGLFYEARNLEIDCRKVGDVYEFFVDAEKFISLYGNYINEETKDMILLVNDIPYDKIVDSTMEEVNGMVIQKISDSYLIESKYGDKVDLEVAKQMRTNYLYILFGLNSYDAFEDSENLKYHEEFLANIESSNSSNSNESSKKIIDEILDAIRSDNNSLNQTAKDKIENS